MQPIEATGDTAAVTSDFTTSVPRDTTVARKFAISQILFTNRQVQSN
jgi:hypothetical protein